MHCISILQITACKVQKMSSVFSFVLVRRPSGIPEQDFCSFLMPYYQKQEAYMREELKKIQAENAALAQNVQDGRESIAETERNISSAVDEWKVRTESAKQLTYVKLLSMLEFADEK